MSTDTPITSRAFGRELRRATTTPILAFGTTAVALLGLIAYLLTSMYWADHANRVIGRILQAQTLLLDVQTATRGYYLSGDPAFLAPYRESRPEIGQTMAGLRSQVSDNPLQMGRVDRLNAQSQEWLAWVARTLAATAPLDGDRPTTEALRDGKQVFDQIRADIDGLLATEVELRDQRSARTRRAALWTIAAVVLAGAGVGVGQAISTRRRLRRAVGEYRDALEVSEGRRMRVGELLDELDREMQGVAAIQRSLLPIELPPIPGVDLAASYQTSRRAGGDYYDFFKLPAAAAEPADEPVSDPHPRYGILIADVSGHGTPAAVLMAVTHSIAHGIERPPAPPSDLLTFVNRRLCGGYTTGEGVSFVTAFFGVYDPANRDLHYSSAGHNPPRLYRDGRARPLDEAQSLPLGVVVDAEYLDAHIRLEPGDLLVLYTDGITEARPAEGEFELFGVDRLDAAVRGDGRASDSLKAILDAVGSHAAGALDDDRTVVVMRVDAAGSPREGDADNRRALVESTYSGVRELVGSAEPHPLL